MNPRVSNLPQAFGQEQLSSINPSEIPAIQSDAALDAILSRDRQKFNSCLSDFNLGCTLVVIPWIFIDLVYEYIFTSNCVFVRQEPLLKRCLTPNVDLNVNIISRLYSSSINYVQMSIVKDT